MRSPRGGRLEGRPQCSGRGVHYRAVAALPIGWRVDWHPSMRGRQLLRANRRCDRRRAADEGLVAGEKRSIHPWRLPCASGLGEARSEGKRLRRRGGGDPGSSFETPATRAPRDEGSSTRQHREFRLLMEKGQRPYCAVRPPSVRSSRRCSTTSGAQNIVLALAEVSGIGWITSQCSTTLPPSRRKMSTTASPRGLSDRPCQ